jgi:hypothetical protein
VAGKKSHKVSKSKMSQWDEIKNPKNETRYKKCKNPQIAKTHKNAKNQKNDPIS